MFGFVAGIAYGVTSPDLIALPFLFLLLLIGLLVRRVSTFVSMLLAGVVWVHLWGAWQLSHQLPQALIKSDWRLVAEIIEVSQQPALQRLLVRPIKLSQAAGDGSELPLRYLRLNYYQKDEGAPSLVAGDYIDAEVRLTPPHGLANPSGFDYEGWLLSRKIDATGYIRDKPSLVKLEQCSLSCYRNNYDQWLKDRYGENAHSMIRALMLGWRDLLSDSEQGLLRSTGTVHLVVVSGMHFGFLYLLLVALGGYAAKYFPSSCYRLVPAILAGVGMLAYLLLSGASPSALRAFVMISVVMFSSLMLGKITVVSRFLLAMIAVLLIDPLALLSAGFWFSFTLVAGLILIIERPSGLLGVRTQWAVFLLITPLLLFVIGEAPLSATLVNLLAIPFIGLLLSIIWLDQFVSLLGIDLLVDLVRWMVSLFWSSLELVASVLTDKLVVTDMSVWALLLLLLVGFLLLLPIKFSVRALLLLTWLLVFYPANFTERKLFDVWVFDVGQGLSVLVESNDQYLLYDTGAGFRTGTDMFTLAVLPYLEERAINLDYLVLSHPDNDHSGGALSVLNHNPDVRVVSGGLKGYSIPVSQSCQKGDRWQLGGVAVEVLSGSKGGDRNNRSCVLNITGSACALLLTGDADLSIEESLPLPRYELSYWLVLGHHGSKTSSSETFLSRYNPKIAIASAGYGNRYHHPNQEVVSRLQRMAIPLINTAVAGAVHLSEQGENCHFAGYRQMRPLFWHLAP